MLCRATQDRRVMVESSDKRGPLEGNGNTSIFLPWQPHEQYEKGKIMTMRNELSRLVGIQYATGEEWKNNSRRMKKEPKWKQCPAVDVTGDGSKLWCCKEQYCIGTWNVRSVNQGKLEVVKQETTRMTINILGISELKWIGMGKFNSDDHYIYYCGQESHGKNGVALMVNKRVQNAVLWGNLKNNKNDLCSFPRQTIQYHSNTSLCPDQ